MSILRKTVPWLAIGNGPMQGSRVTFGGIEVICIAWEPEALLDALDALEQAIPTDDKLFPKPDKAGGPQLVEGNRNNELNTLIFRKAQAGQTAFTEERAVAIASGLDAAEVDATIQSAREAASKKRAPTEHDVALSFTERYRDTFRYCPDLRRWFGWDNTRWRPDTLGRAFHRARELCSEASKARAPRKAGFARGVEAFCQADPAHAVEASYWGRGPLEARHTGRHRRPENRARHGGRPSTPDKQAGGSRTRQGQRVSRAGFNSWTNRPAATPN